MVFNDIAKLHYLPNISIVTPSFNQGQYLEQTICSVLDQQYPNLEYFVMDGGSTDNSISIIRKYAAKLTYWQSTPDGGQAAAIKAGFDRGKGEILMWLNSDDYLLPGALYNIGKFFVKHRGIDLVVGRSIVINWSGKLVRKKWPLKPTFENILHWGCGFNQPASAWLRTSYEAIGGIDPTFQFCLDRDLYLRILARGKASSISHYLAAFRVHQAAKSTRCREIQHAESQRIEAEWCRECVPHVNRVAIRWRNQSVARLLGLAAFFSHSPVDTYQ